MITKMKKGLIIGLAVLMVFGLTGMVSADVHVNNSFSGSGTYSGGYGTLAGPNGYYGAQHDLNGSNFSGTFDLFLDNTAPLPYGKPTVSVDRYFQVQGKIEVQDWYERGDTFWFDTFVKSKNGWATYDNVGQFEAGFGQVESTITAQGKYTTDRIVQNQATFAFVQIQAYGKNGMSSTVDMRKYYDEADAEIRNWDGNYGQGTLDIFAGGPTFAHGLYELSSSQAFSETWTANAVTGGSSGMTYLSVDSDLTDVGSNVWNETVTHKGLTVYGYWFHGPGLGIEDYGSLYSE